MINVNVTKFYFLGVTILKKNTLKSLDVDVINFILHNNNASIDELSNCFDVSQVNIRTILAKIEEFVAEQNLGKLLKENGHYYFENNIIDLDFDLEPFLSDDLEKKERITYIILKLILEGSLNLTSISKELGISRITLNSDIEIIREIVNDFNLNLTSIQWKGIFFEGSAEDLQSFSIFFIAKLYIENYFSSPLKEIVNPNIQYYFREFLSYEVEKKLTNLANKIYHYFNINLGVYYYHFLLALLIYIYLGVKKGIKFSEGAKNSSLDLTESLDDILDSEDRELIDNNLNMIISYLSVCINKECSVIFPFIVEDAIQEIYSSFDLNENSLNSQLLSFFVTNIYFENRFFIPSYIKFNKKDEKLLNDSISIRLMVIFDRYKIPYSRKNIAFLYYFLKEELSQTKKKNILIVDYSAMTWKANKLKDKLRYLEQVNAVQVSSYFNFKLFPIETYKKYDIFIFIDLPVEKKANYSKQCYFINSYELLKNSLNISKLLEI